MSFPKIDVQSIAIPTDYFRTLPSAQKVHTKRLAIAKGTQLPITLNHTDVLVDGYVTLLCYLEMGVLQVPYIRRDLHYPVDKGVTTFGNATYLQDLLRGKEIKCVRSTSRATRKPVAWLLPKLVKQQNNKCYLCGRTMNPNSPDDTPTIDHLVPISLGGTNVRSNMKACCYRCNILKDQFIYSEELRVVIKRQRDYENARQT